MANQYKNKIVYNGTVLLDLSTDTITLPEHIMAGFVGHLADGTQVTGTGQGGGSGNNYIRTTICPEQTVVSTSPPEDDTDMLLMTSTDDLVEGDYYLVTVNGAERVQTAVRNNYVLYLCDITDTWFDGNRMVIMADGDIYFCPWDAGSYTVKVEHLELNGSGGSGGDSSATLTTKIITANGTYSAEDDSADGYSEVTVSIPNGTAGTPTATKGTVSNNSVTITPSVTNTTGYITGGTLTGTGVTVSASELVSGSQTITQNNTYDVTNLASVVVNVPSGGGTAMNVQVAQSTTRSTSTSYTEVISLTCDVTGTYDIYWTTFRSSTSSTWGSQLYINDVAYETADTENWSNHIQNEHLTGVQITAGQEVAVRVRSRGSNYYGYVGTLTIKQTA